MQGAKVRRYPAALWELFVVLVVEAYDGREYAWERTGGMSRGHYMPKTRADLVEWFRMYKPDYQVRSWNKRKLWAVFYRIMQDARE